LIVKPYTGTYENYLALNIPATNSHMTAVEVAARTMSHGVVQARFGLWNVHNPAMVHVSVMNVATRDFTRSNVLVHNGP
jgi:hypothetical protein